MRTGDDALWSGAYKIPWNDPDFSERMLAEHLSQDHDLASRRCVWIDRQVAWIHRNLLREEMSDILDLGCGPGLYSHRLATLGHRCRGIDFGPASIEYARKCSPCQSRCQFVPDDIRHAPFGGPFDLAMILFGEMNVFSEAEILAILCKCHACLAPKCGRLIVEIQTAEAVECLGRGGSSEQELESGLFSARPHRCRTEHRWLPGQQAAIQTFTITETASMETRVYRNTTRAWPADDLTALLKTAGFSGMAQHDDWPCNTDCLALWSARAA